MVQINNHIRIRSSDVGNILFEDLIFPGGEVHIKLTPPVWPLRSNDKIYIYAHARNSVDVMRLLMITDALRRMGAVRIMLDLPYIPYARQDRVANTGEALSIQVFAQLINAQKYEKVVVYDAHSEVSLALIDRVYNVSQDQLLLGMKKYITPDKTVLVAPDAGALKKAHAVAKELGIVTVLHGGKIRDTKTGAITGTEVYTNRMFRDFSFLIVDDICDGGKTFIELAKVLQPLHDSKKQKIFLAVTHGIFSKGLEVFDGYIDHIYVVEPWYTIDTGFVTIV